jgi:flagellar hook-associated protein 1 FlgK
MSNLFASLHCSAETLRTIQKSLEIAQNNVANATTPGYARQSITPLARPFDPDTGGGGVTAGPMQSDRSQLAEQNVRRWLSDQGRSDAATELLEGIESAVPVSGGIPDALNSLLRSFSSWSLAPSDTNARQAVV